MEDTLRESHRSLRYHYQVLILVLMEDTLRAEVKNFDKAAIARLNPCFNGRYSQSHPCTHCAYVPKKS